MFCSKCGTKIEDDSKFCPTCGTMFELKNQQENLEENVLSSEKENSNFNEHIEKPISKEISKGTGGIRKALKKDAKTKTKGLYLATILIFAITIISVLIVDAFTVTTQADYYLSATTELSPGGYIAEILISIVSVFIAFGYVAMSLDKARGKEVSVKGLFTKPIENWKGILKYFGLILVIIIALSLISAGLLLIPFIGFLVIIAFLILFIYYMPVLHVIFFQIIDDEKENTSFIEEIKEAIAITKGHRVEYYGLIFSFVGWMLLAPFTLGIIYIWFYPYMMVSYANMYRRWKGEITFTETESGISNGAVIGIVAGVYTAFIITIVLLVLAVFAAFGINIDSFKENLQNEVYDYSDTINKVQDETENKETKTIGNFEVGYIDVPTTWYMGYDTTGKGMYIYQNGTEMITLFNPDNTTYSEALFIEAIKLSFKEVNITDIAETKTTVDGYPATKLTVYFQEEGLYLSSWCFTDSNNKIHYIAIEGPDKNSETFSYIKTYKVK